MKNKRTIHLGRYLGLLELDDWEFVSRTNATGVVVLVAVNSSQELILVEQFRPPVQQNVIELPAGLVGDLGDPNESMLNAARRELLEETGYWCESPELLLSCPSSAGMSDEIVTFVMALRLERRGPGGGDSSENITVHNVPLASANAWLEERIKAGTPVDPKIFAALYWLEKRLA